MEEKQRLGAGRMFVTAVSRPSEYGKFAKIKKRTVVAYVLLVSFLMTLLSGVIPVGAFGVSIGGPKHFLKDTLPAFEMKDGTFSIDHRIVMEYKGLRIIADDGVDTYTKKDLESENLIEVLVSKNNMIIKNAALGNVIKVDFSKLKEGTKFNNQSLVDLLPLFYTGLAVGMVTIFFTSMVNFLFTAIIAMICGRSFCVMQGKKYAYGKAFVYGIMAATAITLVGCMGQAAGFAMFNTVGWTLIEFGVTMTYLYFGIKGEKTETAQ